MKRAASKTAKPRAPAKKRAAPAGVKSAASLMDQMQEQQNLLELQNEQLCGAHAELEQSQQRYADLYDMAPVGYMTLDGKGCIREMNQTASQMLGWSTAHLMGKPLLPHIVAPDRKVWLKHLWESRRSHSQIIITLQLLSKAGVVRKVQFATSREDTTGRQAAWCRTAMLDTTEKSDAQTALSASEAKFRLLAENMGEVFWFTELDPPRVTYVSPAVERVWGIPTLEIYADYFSWMRAIHPDDNDAVQSAFDGWMKSGSTTFDVQYRIIHRDGSTHWIADRGIVVSRRNGQPFEISGIARDITERKEAEQKIIGVLEAAPDAMVIVDRDGIIQMVNAQAMRLFGYERSELVGQVVELLVPDPLRERHVQHRQDLITAPRHGVQHPELELHGRRKDGSEFPAEITLSPLYSEDGILIISAVRDITERKQAEEELCLRNAEVHAKFDELERFNRAMVDRELRMIELKKEINALLAAAGQPPRFRVDFATLETSAPLNP